MNVCVTSTGKTLDSAVDPRFGRCQFFVFIDTDTMNAEAVANPNMETAGGAGIQSAQLVAARQANVVLTGNVGPNAFQTLHAAGIEMFIGASGTVRDAVAAYLKGGLKAAAHPSVGSKSGLMGT